MRHHMRHIYIYIYVEKRYVFDPYAPPLCAKGVNNNNSKTQPIDNTTKKQKQLTNNRASNHKQINTIQETIENRFQTMKYNNIQSETTKITNNT